MTIDQPGAVSVRLYAAARRAMPRGGSLVGPWPSRELFALLVALAERGWGEWDLEREPTLLAPLGSRTAVKAELTARLRALVENGTETPWESQLGSHALTVTATAGGRLSEAAAAAVGLDLVHEMTRLLRETRLVRDLPADDPWRQRWLERKHQLVADISAYGPR